MSNNNLVEDDDDDPIFDLVCDDNDFIMYDTESTYHQQQQQQQLECDDYVSDDDFVIMDDYSTNKNNNIIHLTTAKEEAKKKWRYVWEIRVRRAKKQEFFDDVLVCANEIDNLPRPLDIFGERYGLYLKSITYYKSSKDLNPEVKTGFTSFNADWLDNSSGGGFFELRFRNTPPYSLKHNKRNKK